MSFSDTGMLSIHWSTDREQLKKSLRLVQKELDQFRLHGLNETQLRKYKTQFKGQVLMGEDNKSSLMVLLGKSLLDLGKVDTLDEVMEQIDAVNARQLYETANELLLPELKSTLIYHPGA
jgi:predicted Zn-dependent peptidase